MDCQKPFMVGALPCRCQKCFPCLINRRRVWTHRLILEGFLHANSCFATLTYSQENYPKDGSLQKKEVQDWLKRFRRAVEPVNIRFFLAGEYGSKTQRPHYHVALFGIDRFNAGGIDGCSGAVQATWRLGHTFVGELNSKSSAYVCGYVTKKFKEATFELKGRQPEFIRMSLRPGIGAGSVETIVNAISTDPGLDSIVQVGDVPSTLRHSTKLLPIGRYLRGKLRQTLGFSEPTKAPQDALKKYIQETLPELRKSYQLAAQGTSRTGQEIMLDELKQKSCNLRARHKLHFKETL